MKKQQETKSKSVVLSSSSSTSSTPKKVDWADEEELSTDDVTDPSEPLVNCYKIVSVTPSKDVQIVESPSRLSTKQILANGGKANQAGGIKSGLHYTTCMRLFGGASSDGNAFRYSAVKFDPSGCSDWSSFAAIFDEFRVIKAHIQFAPYYQYSTADTGVLCVAADNDSTGAPTSADQVMQYGTAKFSNLQQARSLRLTYKRPNITSSAYWNDVASPTASEGTFLIAVIDCSTTNGRGLYYFTVTYEIEFRSRR